MLVLRYRNAIVRFPEQNEIDFKRNYGVSSINFLKKVLDLTIDSLYKENKVRV